MLMCFVWHDKPMANFYKRIWISVSVTVNFNKFTVGNFGNRIIVIQLQCNVILFNLKRGLSSFLLCNGNIKGLSRDVKLKFKNVITKRSKRRGKKKVSWTYQTGEHSQILRSALGENKIKQDFMPHCTACLIRWHCPVAESLGRYNNATTKMQPLPQQKWKRMPWG